MFEDPGTPTFLGLCAEEWHAVAMGLKEGLMPWKRQPRKYGDFVRMMALPDADKELSPEIIKDCEDKYHYYIVAFALPEDVAFLCVLAWLLVTHGADAARIALQHWNISVM